MKSKILSFNILKETMKKQVWIPALIFLGFFLSLPVMGMLYLEIIQSRDLTQAEAIEAYIRLIAGTRFPFLAMMTMGSALLTGVSSFSWLHSRVKTDFYHSLPVRREKIFFGRVVLGVLYYAVPYLVNLLLVYVVGIIHGIFQGDVVRISLLSFLYQCMFYVLMYLVVVLAMMLTGKVLTGVLGAFVLTFYSPLMSEILQGLASTFFDTFFSGETRVQKFFERLSPVVSYLTCQSGDPFVVESKVWIMGGLAVVVLFVLCFCLYKKRPSEAAGRTMAFFRLGKVIQYMIEVLVILCSGILFYSVAVRGYLGWMLFGVLLGGVLIHGIMEVIYEGDVRRVMAHTWMMGASIVTSLLVIGIYYGDVFGYDRFFPEQDSLQWVDIQAGDTDYSSFRNMYKDRGQEQKEAMEKQARDPQVYEILQEIMENSLEKVKLQDGTEYRKKDGTSADEIRYVKVVYGLGKDRVAFRGYYVDHSQYKQQLLSLFNSEAYKKTTYPLTTMTEEELESCIEQATIISSKGGRTSVFEGNAQERAEFLKTYRAELMQIDEHTLKDEIPIGRMELTAHWGSKINGQDVDQERAGMIENDDYFIYPSFTRTLAVLEKQKAGLVEAFDPKEVESITLYDYQTRDGEDSKEEKIQDRAQIAELLPCLVSEECDNGYIEFEDSLGAVVEFNDKGYSVTEYCQVLKGQMPDLK